VIVPLRAGDFDLSVASVMVVTGCLVGMLTQHGMSALEACLLAVLVGPVVGLINGLLVVRCGIDSFIVTLGMVTIGYGVATAISGGTIVSSLPEGLTHFAADEFLQLPMPVWIGWIVALLVWYAFEFTPAGRYLLFIGGSRSAANLAGLRVKSYRQVAFLFSGTLSAVAGLLYAGTLGAVDPSSASSYLLPPITAVFLGASAIQIGRFNVLGTIVGIYLLAIGITGLQLLGVQSWIGDVFNGGVLILAVLVGVLLQGRGRRASVTTPTG
jgi:ribose transport system permease protein